MQTYNDIIQNFLRCKDFWKSFHIKGFRNLDTKSNAEKMFQLLKKLCSYNYTKYYCATSKNKTNNSTPQNTLDVH